jgi:hypothetical protein
MANRTRPVTFLQVRSIFAVPYVIPIGLMSPRILSALVILFASGDVAIRSGTLGPPALGLLG